VCVPTHGIPEKDFFLKRLEDSLAKQTFQDFELVITEDGKMAENSNSAIKKAKGEIIKMLYMDDYLFSPYALQNIVDNYEGTWLASGCLHDDGTTMFNAHYPTWNDDVKYGKNTIGSPSVIAFPNDNPLLFDERMTWLLDCHLYGRLFERYGHPTLINKLDVGIGVGPHQMTNKLTEEEKAIEHTYL